VTDSTYGNVTEREIHNFLQTAGNCDIYDGKETTKLLLSKNYTLEKLTASPFRCALYALGLNIINKYCDFKICILWSNFQFNRSVAMQQNKMLTII
jgi:hypothetical protein